MNRLLKLCLFAAFILLMIPFAASAAESDLESVAVQLENADSIDSQLALINDAAETFSDILSAGGWDISLNIGSRQHRLKNGAVAVVFKGLFPKKLAL